VEAFLREQPNLAYKTGNATCGECTTREAKEKDLIARVVIVREKTVCFSNIFAEAFTGCA
jgi:hypothetical protein